MEKKKILIQLDSDPHASVFDRVVAVDAGVDELFSYGGVRPDDVRGLVYGAIFTRGPKDLHRTALFIGGSDVSAGEGMLRTARDSFFGPLRISLMLDANGANTTAAAAVLAAGKHVALEGAIALVLAGTGPVGQRAARLLAGERASVRLGSRSRDRAEAVCAQIRQAVPGSRIDSAGTASEPELRAALDGASIVIAAGAAGVGLLSEPILHSESSVRVAIDLNAVPPLGIEGIDSADAGADRQGVISFGAIGVGATKMKIHRAAVRQLFERNDQVLDADEIYRIGKQLTG